ncbi:Uncharacterised protein [Mannheimia haemolytica]|uniref:DUF4810 domain-containing protein n=1 Tax=Mannheimia haemolytica TaxID=75985 RepID=A0A448T9N4_MANHA|nr:DUF4810 domain-containing protein [Mannheimia haemolytica]VEI76575.1 Uncharacterised protein [Mannheimia haemolytica]HDV7284067.1 DUF4810 domain-containing protein [Mannheimia haemolytica]
MKIIKLIGIATGVLLLAACAGQQKNTDLYHWGNYSDVVYSHYNEPGDFAKQEQSLNQIISQAKELNKPVAPGVYGHLGLALLKQGKSGEAKAAFQQEQSLYPESTQFIQFLQRKK